MEHTIKHTKNGSIYFTDTFRNYRSLKRFGEYHIIQSIFHKRTPSRKNLPKQNDIEANKEIKDRWPLTKVFFLSMEPSEFYNQNVEIITDGFVTKNSMKNSLLAMSVFEQSNLFQQELLP